MQMKGQTKPKIFFLPILRSSNLEKIKTHPNQLDVYEISSTFYNQALVKYFYKCVPQV